MLLDVLNLHLKAMIAYLTKPLQIFYFKKPKTDRQVLYCWSATQIWCLFYKILVPGWDLPHLDFIKLNTFQQQVAKVTVEFYQTQSLAEDS